jgi:hypothetical protein
LARRQRRGVCRQDGIWRERRQLSEQRQFRVEVFAHRLDHDIGSRHDICQGLGDDDARQEGFDVSWRLQAKLMVGVARQVRQRAGLRGDPLPRRGQHRGVGVPHPHGPATAGDQGRDLTPHRAGADDRGRIQLPPALFSRNRSTTHLLVSLPGRIPADSLP